MEKRIAIQSKNERITEKRAVAVAEWLGGFIEMPGEHGTYENENYEYVFCPDDLVDWLYTAEGQEALREKLLSEDRGIYEETGMVVISWADETVEEKDLLHAVLKMLEEGDKDAI